MLKSMNSPARMRSCRRAGTGGRDKVGSSVMSRAGASGLRVVVVSIGGIRVPDEGLVGINMDLVFLLRWVCLVRHCSLCSCC